VRNPRSTPAAQSRAAAGTAPPQSRYPVPGIPALGRADAAALAVLAAAVLAIFAPWWLDGRILAPFDLLHEVIAPWAHGGSPAAVHNHFTSDAITQYLVYRHIAELSFAQDGGLGWSVLTAGGRPEYANTMAGYGDWSMQLHRVLGFWTAWHAGLALTFLIAAAGMYLMLREQQVAPLVALAGSVAFAASTPMVFMLYHRWQLASFAWLPWLVWAVNRHAAGDVRVRALIPCFLALALVGGSLQTAVFVLIVWSILWAAAVAAGGDARAATVRFAAWGALGAGLAAYVLVPALAAYAAGIELHGGRSVPGYPHGVQQALRSLGFIPLQLVPTLLGSPRSLDLTKLFHADLGQIAFFGFVPMLVAALAAVRGGVPLPARLLVAAGLVLPLTPLVGTLYHRVQILFVFGGVWAFAYWWQHAHGCPLRRLLPRAVVCMAAVWLVASTVLWLFEDRLAALLHERVSNLLARGEGGRLAGHEEWFRARGLRLLHELRIWHPLQLTAVAGIALGIAALRFRTVPPAAPAAGPNGTAPGGAALRFRGVRAHAGAALLLLAVTVELGGTAAAWHRWTDPREYPPWPVTDELAALQASAAGGRVHIAATYDGPAPFLPPNTLAVLGVETIQHYETVEYPGMWEAAGRATDARTLGRMGVTHGVAPAGTVPGPGWEVRLAGSTLDIWVNRHALPRYLPVRRDTALAMSDIHDAADGAAPGTVIDVHAATMNRRRLYVPAGVEAVRVAENWAEGWQYRRAGEPWQDATMLPDRSMLLSLSGSAGGVVEMRYAPRLRLAGRVASGLALLLTALCGAAAMRRAVPARPVR
jgi:hypothetical protein